MVCNVSDSTAEISNLIYALNCNLDEYDRCNEMLMRVNSLEHDTKVPEEILDYISGYSDICAEVLTTATEDTAPSSNGVITVIKKILSGLKNAILKIYEFIVRIFKTLFDKQYRSRKQFSGITRNLILLGSSPELVKKFEAIPCAVISQADAIKVTQYSKELVNMIRFCVATTTHEAIDETLQKYSSNCAISVKMDQFTDICASVQGRKWDSFAQAGWTLKGLQDCIDAHVNSLTGVESLKETKAGLEKEIKALEKRVDAAMNSNASVDEVRDLQQTIAFKLRLTRIVGNSIAIINNRTTGISNVLRAIYEQALILMEESGLIDKTFLRKAEDFLKS